MELQGAQEWDGREGPGLQAAAALVGVEGASSHPAQQPLLQGVQDRSWGHPILPLVPQAEVLSQRPRGPVAGSQGV